MNVLHRLLKCVFGLLIVCSLEQVHAQGTITFDGPPVVLPGTDIGFTSYSELGMTFRPINVGQQFGRMGGGREDFPDNGTAFVILGAFDSFSGFRNNSNRFGLYSVDLAEFSTLYNVPKTVEFIGYTFDGSMVTNQFLLTASLMARAERLIFKRSILTAVLTIWCALMSPPSDTRWTILFMSSLNRALRLYCFLEDYALWLADAGNPELGAHDLHFAMVI